MVSTSGAGDSLVAGCLLGLLQGQSAADAVSLGLVRSPAIAGPGSVMLHAGASVDLRINVRLLIYAT